MMSVNKDERVTRHRKILVNAGPPKCGTTSLYHSLLRSGCVNTPQIKEPRFFATNESDDYKNLPDFLRIKGHYDYGIDWFLSQFHENDDRYYIDFTTFYSVTKETPRLLKKHFDDIKCVMLMRDPVDRFLSHYWDIKRKGFDIPELDEIIDTDSEISNYLFRFSDYEEIHNFWLRGVGDHNLLLLRFEDMLGDTRTVEKTIAEFIGCSGFSYNPKEWEINPAAEPRFRPLTTFLFSTPLSKITGSVPPGFKPALLKLRKKLINLNKRELLAPEVRRDTVRTLETKLDRSIAFHERAVSSDHLNR